MVDRHNLPEYLKIHEAARFLGVNPRTVYRHIKAGKLPASMVGGLYLIRRSDLEAVLTESRLEPKAEEPAARTVLRCGSCYRILASESQVANTCAAQGCEEVVCKTCQAEGKQHCAQHQPTPQDRLQAALLAQARGELPLVLRSSEARLREVNFIERILARLTGIATFIHPVSGEAFTVKDWQGCLEQGDQRAEIMRLLNKVFLDAQTLAQLPLNAWFSARPSLPKGSRSLPVEIHAQVLSHLAAHVNEGFDTFPLGLTELQPLLSGLIEETLARQSFRLALLASTTGWDESARRLVAATDRPGQAFTGRFALVYLFDMEKGDLIFNAQDDRTRGYAELFVPLLVSEQISEAAALIEKELLVYDSLTLEHASRTLPFSQEILNQAFQRLAQGESYALMDMPRLGLTLIRN